MTLETASRCMTLRRLELTLSGRLDGLRDAITTAYLNGCHAERVELSRRRAILARRAACLWTAIEDCMPGE